MKQYVGKPPKNPEDRFDRRVVPQLADISFEEDSEEDFEDVKNIKRQPMTVLTEANLKNILTGETTKLNIEHHYWLKDAFLLLRYYVTEHSSSGKVFGVWPSYI